MDLLHAFPQMSCFCDKNWYHLDELCRTPGARNMILPVTCPLDYVFMPEHFDDAPEEWGPPIHIRVYSFLDDPRLPASVKVPGGVLYLLCLVPATLLQRQWPQLLWLQP
jgi:hypothetical protein